MATQFSTSTHLNLGQLRLKRRCLPELALKEAGSRKLPTLHCPSTALTAVSKNATLTGNLMRTQTAIGSESSGSSGIYLTGKLYFLLLGQGNPGPISKVIF